MSTSPSSPSSLRHSHPYRYGDFITVGFITILLCSNLFGAGKITQWGDISFTAGTLFFPISYVLGDILTEVYGYHHARRTIWAGLGALLFAFIASSFVLALPPAKDWHDQTAYETVFGTTGRIIFASLFAFWVGELSNSWILALLKIKTQGRFLWLRTMTSTLVGEGLDTLLFFPLAFYGVLPTPLLLEIMLASYVLKCAWEFAATPITYAVVIWLKRAEGIDHYDTHTRFNPFILYDEKDVQTSK